LHSPENPIYLAFKPDKSEDVVALTIKQLRYVESAGRLGSIAAASGELHISQSSVTAAIDAVEAHLGFDLFSRVPARGIQPTPAGRDALRLMAGHLGAFRDFEAELSALGGTTTGEVRVACFATAAASFLPPLLTRFAVAYPGVKVTLREGNMETVLDTLEDGQSDLAFTYADVVPDHLLHTPLSTTPLYALVSTQDPLSGRPELALEDLQDRPMILLELPRNRRYYSDIFRRKGLAPRIAHVTGSTEMIRTLVESGIGYSILNARPPNYVEGGRGYRAVPLVDAGEARVFGYVTRPGIGQPGALRSFLAHVAMAKEEGLFDRIAIRAAATE